MKYSEQGFVLVEGLIDESEIKSIKDDIDNIFKYYTGDDGETDQMVMNLFKNDFDGFHGCAQLCQNMVSLTRLSTHPSIISAIIEVGIKFPTINTRPLLSISSKNTAKDTQYWLVPAHQDWPSTQGSINGLNCWMPLVDTTSDLGPLEVVPKSHTLGYLDHHEEGVPALNNNQQDFVSVPMKPGDALIFSNFLIHRSGVNVTDDKIRWSTHFRYDDALEPTFKDRKFPRHRIDRRKEGILYPGFPTPEQMQKEFK